MNNMYTKILVVDSSAAYTNKITQQLKSANLKHPTFPQYHVKVASTSLDALLISQDFQPDCVLLSFALPDMDGFELLDSLTEIRGGLAVPALLLLEPDADYPAAHLSKRGGCDCLVKNEFDGLQLMWALFCVLEQAKLEKKIQRKHQELKIFADRMAHDLLVSLSKLSICAEYLEMKNEAESARDTEQQHVLNIMVESVDHTIGLVESFRNYAHVERLNVMFSNVNLNSIMAHILLLLKPKIDDIGVQIHAEPLPVVVGDHLGLGQLLHTLVENAIEQCNHESTIHIQTTKCDTKWQICITTSAVNADLPRTSPRADASSADVVTHRALSFSEISQPDDGYYPGTAIELATCRLIVEQHGGTLRFCSTAEGEKVFYFTLEQDLETTNEQPSDNAFEDIALSNQPYSASTTVLNESISIYHSAV